LNNYLFQIRVTGVLVENGKILLVNQKVTQNRSWSLPGGRLEHCETLEEGIKREFFEETGLKVKVIRLLYVCEKPDIMPPLVHITFELEKESGEITFPTNEFDENPISDVKWVNINELSNYGFSEKFQEIVLKSFPDSGSYMGLKSTIGL
jgi:ADP-ribose pyrophosphatase YjhB (NUDIX family)